MSAPQVSPREKVRFKAQLLRIQSLYLSHPGFYTLGELARAIGAISESGLSARLRELAPEDGSGAWTKEVRMRKYPVREYRLRPSGAPTQLDLLP